MTQNTQKPRDLSLDVAKGMCIILMVVAHSGCPEWMSRFIYMFHMPCFFFISGMLLSDRYLDTPGVGVRKKLKGYYKPFVKWQLVFLLLHNLFVALHVIAAEPYGWRDIPGRVVRVITMTGGEQLLGGYWFLISLTWASIGSILLLVLLKKCKALNMKAIGGGILLIVALASVEHLLPLGIPSQFQCQTLLALALFLSGYAYKKLTRGVEPRKLRPLMLLLLVPLIVSLWWHTGMSGAEGLSWLYYVVAMCGTLGFLQLTGLLRHGKVAAAVNYIGGKTLYILTFHFLCFKPVSLLWLWAHGDPLDRLSEFPILAGTDSMLWVAYTLAGVALPLVIWEAKERLGRAIG